ncbi:3-isopropylmalate dehydratase [Halobellus salinisoli]|uniref:LeuD/DmdB family oxidoreductase small subunit n=1 Tax=Halobellus salinisoli TaxID=3108500 RepID=UPI003009DB02
MSTAFLFGDNIDTDLIAPTTADEDKTLVELCMSGVDPSFHEKFGEGDVVVAGENFGCGSSRETAPLSLRRLGADAIIASSFARIFYRNAINIGLPVFEIADATAKFSQGDDVVVDRSNGVISNESSGISYSAPSHPAFLEEIIDAGGLIEYGNRKIDRRDGHSE